MHNRLNLAAHAIALCGLAAAPAARAQDQAAGDVGPAESQYSQALEGESYTGIFGLKAAPIDDDLATDRPDFTESTETVPWGRFQIEADYTFTYDRESRDRVRDHTVAGFLLRMGIVEDFELRFGWGGYSVTQLNYDDQTRGGRTVGREEWVQGANDLSFGFKVKLFEQDGLRPHFSVIGEFSVPSGTRGFSSGDVDPAVLLVWAYDLSDRWSVGGNINFAVVSEEGDRFFQPATSVAVGYSIDDRWGAYMEYFGFYPNSEHTDCAHTINGGLTYLVTNNLQLDIRAGFGLNEEADDFFTGVGFSWRF